MAGFVQPHLIQAHASLIGAPHARDYDPLDEQIRQEQLRGMRIRNDQASLAPSAGVRTSDVANHPSSYFKEPDRVKIWNEPTHAGGSWNPHEESAVIQRQKKRPISQTVEKPQEQLQKIAAQKALQKIRDDQVVESTERFGRHSPDAQWDPGNGGRWVRPYRPGEFEAMAAAQTGAVKDYFDALAGQRAHEYKLEENAAANQNAASLYGLNRITDMNMKSKIENVANVANATGTTDATNDDTSSVSIKQSPIRRQFGALLSSALEKIRNRGKEAYGEHKIDASFLNDYDFGVPGKFDIPGNTANADGEQGVGETADDYDDDSLDSANSWF